MPVRFGQTNEDVPPIVEQRDEARGEAAARQIMRREAAPTPLVLQFVENILRVAAIAIELAKAGEVLDERGGQNAILMDVIAGADLEERQLRQAWLSPR